MSATSLEERIAKLRWEASAHTLAGREKRISEEALKQAATRFERGAFADVVRRLESEPCLADDSRALVFLGLARLGTDDYGSALDAMDRAREIIKEDLAKVEVNRSLVLSLLGRYEDALDATRMARELAPHFWSSLLAEIVVLERRRGPSDRKRVLDLAKEVASTWPEWRTLEIARYLAIDADYAALRREEGGEVFRSAFGVHPDELIAQFKPHTY